MAEHKADVCDGFGFPITSTEQAGNKRALDVSAVVTVDPAGLATSAKQDTGNASLASIDSKLSAGVKVTQAAAETTASQNLASGSLSKVTAQTTAFRLVSVGIKFSAVVTQTVQVKYTSPNGTNYDYILDSTGLVGQTSYFAFWDNLVFISGGQITVTCTNTGTPAATANLTVTTVPT